MSNKRVFIIVLDSLGIGYMPDADKYGDIGSNTLKAIIESHEYNTPNLAKLGLFNIEGIDFTKGVENPLGCYARMKEMSNGKDTIIGHWEISGIISENPLPTYPNGFPSEIIDRYAELTGRNILCNKPYSGTQLLLDYGKAHQKTGDLIVYTSADSVFQVAAHEDVVPVEKLYEYCKIAREMMVGKHSVGRIIARPFIGDYPNYKRTSNRRDFSIKPPERTMLDDISMSGLDVVGIGKIYDIFNGEGITKSIKTKDNTDGMNKTINMVKEDFSGLCFTNLVDFDTFYGHRNDINGYARSMTEFDVQLGEMIDVLKEDDVVIITADHGCDPSSTSTDHTREYTPMIIFGNNVEGGINLSTRNSFADIGSTIVDYLEVVSGIKGESFWNIVRKKQL